MSDREHELDNTAAIFRLFAEQWFEGSALYQALSAAAADDPELLELTLDTSHERRWPTLFFSAVHYLLLKQSLPPTRGRLGGGLSNLAGFFASLTPDPGPPSEAYPAFREYCLEHRAELAPLLATRVTQTNEVGRSGYLLPAMALIAREARRPLALVEVGCSAGLNLVFDRYGYQYSPGGEVGPSDSRVTIRTEVRGSTAPPLPHEMPPIGFRVGLDKSPIDVLDADERLWLEACVWPEQQERRELLEGAFQAAMPDPPLIVQGDALDDLDRVIAGTPRDHQLVIYHTTVLPYIAGDRQPALVEKLRHLMNTRDACWLFCEAASMSGSLIPAERDVTAAMDPTSFALGLVTLRDERILAAAGPHGKWIEWMEGI